MSATNIPKCAFFSLDEIAKVEEAGLSDHTRIHLRRGAGAYICGEESAMIESIEGKRGLPRHRPPYVAQVGLFGRPTLEQNVETLFWIRDIVEKGAEWVTSQGRHERKGFRSFSVSGRVKNPGVKLAPAGVTARELIDEFCGGMADGHTFKGYLPGGASGGILPASMADMPLDFGTLEKYGCFVGSHAVVILSDKDDMKAVALNLIKFFEDESCGQCTPCRVGTEKAAKLMAKGPWDPALLDELSALMRDASICGLGQAAPNPLLCVLKYFPDELNKPLGIGDDTIRGTARSDDREIGAMSDAKAPKAQDLHHRRPRDRHPRRRDDLPRRAPARHQAAASVLLAEARLPRRTAIAASAWSRSRASACWPQAASATPSPGMKVKTQTDRAKTARKMVAELLLTDQPAIEVAHDPDSELWKTATRLKRRAPAASRSARRTTCRRPTAAIRRWRSISTPASSAISASAPAAKCRSTTSSAWPAAATAKRSCSTSTIRWALRPASPAANACRPARPAR